MLPSKTVRVPLFEAGEGCRLLVEKVRSHVSNATLLANAGRREGAFLFILLGFEESGKLLHLIRSAAVAETQHTNAVELKDFADHEGKASLTAEYVGRVLDIIASALRSAGFPDESLGGYLDHVTAVGNGFMDLRASAMFVDYVNGMWSSDRPVSTEFLQMDLGSLGLFVSIAEQALEKHKSFRGLVAMFDSLDKELREGLSKFFRELARITSGSPAKPGDEMEQQLRESNAEKDFGTGG